MPRDSSLVSWDQEDAIQRDDPSSFSFTGSNCLSSYASSLVDLIVEYRAFKIYRYVEFGSISEKMNEARDRRNWKAIKFFLDFLMTSGVSGRTLRNLDEVRYLLTKGYDNSYCDVESTPPMVYLIMIIGRRKLAETFGKYDRKVSETLSNLEINITSYYSARHANKEYYSYIMLYDTIEWEYYMNIVDSEDFYSMIFPEYQPVLHRLIADQAYHILDRNRLFLSALRDDTPNDLLLLKSMGFSLSSEMIDKLRVFSPL